MLIHWLEMLTARLAAFRQGLQQFGWTDGRNVHFDVRWGAGDADASQICGGAGRAPAGCHFASASNSRRVAESDLPVPIVFVAVIDPVGAGFVASMARPGGNSTGFVTFEYAIAAKWLELLKEIAPSVTRAAVLRDPTYAAGIGQFAAIQSVATDRHGVERDRSRSDADAIERAVAAFAHGSKGGLIVTQARSRQIIRV